jgi:hypothetical protein
VKSHVRNIMKKLSIHTRLQIAAHAHALSRHSPSASGRPSATATGGRETPSPTSLPITAGSHL